MPNRCERWENRLLVSVRAQEPPTTHHRPCCVLALHAPQQAACFNNIDGKPDAWLCPGDKVVFDADRKKWPWDRHSYIDYSFYMVPGIYLDVRVNR